MIDDALVELVRAQDAAKERDLVEQLDAPIFVRLMVERQLNPLGITLFQRDPVSIDNARGEPVIRIEESWSWAITRPYGMPVSPSWRKPLPTLGVKR